MLRHCMVMSCKFIIKKVCVKSASAALQQRGERLTWEILKLQSIFEDFVAAAAWGRGIVSW